MYFIIVVLWGIASTKSMPDNWMRLPQNVGPCERRGWLVKFARSQVMPTNYKKKIAKILFAEHNLHIFLHSNNVVLVTLHCFDQK